MRESSTYQEILQEGRIMCAQKVLLRLGMKGFGAPLPEIQTAIADMTDLDRLDRILDRVFEATSWADLLATP